MASALFVGAVVLVLLFNTRLRSPLILALSIFCGGSLSNLLDRMAFGGNVVDFITVGWGGFRTCIFNLADVAIVLGLILLVPGLIWQILRPAVRRAGAGKR